MRRATPGQAADQRRLLYDFGGAQPAPRYRQSSRPCAAAVPQPARDIVGQRHGSREPLLADHAAEARLDTDNLAGVHVEHDVEADGEVLAGIAHWAARVARQ
jgi:hypothetical protein